MAYFFLFSPSLSPDLGKLASTLLHWRNEPYVLLKSLSFTRNLLVHVMYSCSNIAVVLQLAPHCSLKAHGDRTVEQDHTSFLPTDIYQPWWHGQCWKKKTLDKEKYKTDNLLPFLLLTSPIRGNSVGNFPQIRQLLICPPRSIFQVIGFYMCCCGIRYDTTCDVICEEEIVQATYTFNLDSDSTWL